MIELIIGMGAAIAALLATVLAMRSKIKSKNVVIKQAKAVIEAGGVARVAINDQLKEEKKDEEKHVDSVIRRDYFSN